MKNPSSSVIPPLGGSSKRNPWPYAIVAYFAIFITGIVVWVSFAIRNDQELVRKDYYEHEIKYQNEIDRLERAAAAPARVEHNASERAVTIALPANATDGRIYFYRPSAAKFDRQIELHQTTQTMDLKNFEPGLWKLRLAWKLNGAEYRHDQTLVL